jgi:hypothetical protein
MLAMRKECYVPAGNLRADNSQVVAFTAWPLDADVCFVTSVQLSTGQAGIARVLSLSPAKNKLQQVPVHC